ncbi:MAG: VOC family protein [Alphaproteobacteria bacterium]|nr:VOC family protein [Alphaproteobacteria bacterium]NNF24133.1 VOC family protein [Paracoccaceae bacterium]
MDDTHGTVHWTELMTRDVGAAKAFYEKVCGWSFDQVEMEGGLIYHVAMAHGRPVTGLMDIAGEPGGEGRSSYWLSYIAVDDVDTAARNAKAAGGTVKRAPWDVAGVGRIVLVTDPTGADIGLMTPAEMPDQV